VLLTLVCNSAFALSLNDAKNSAHTTGKKFFVNYTADWCLPCQIFEEQTLSSEEVTCLLQSDFVQAEADFDKTSDQDWFIEYEVHCLPTIHVLDASGQILTELNGNMSKAELIRNLLPFRTQAEDFNKKIEENTGRSVVSRMNKSTLSTVDSYYTIQIGAFNHLKTLKCLV